MLEPTNRLTLIDAMTPPPGFGLESAMAVSFTLDLRALLAAPAAFAISAAEAADREDSATPVELLHALRANAGKLTIFSQVGEIALPPSRRVFAFLERALVPVRAPRHGVVHPKVWVLRYGSSPAVDGEPAVRRMRVLVGSRNLTFDASWDTIIRLDEAAGGRSADIAPIADLFEGLLSSAQRPPEGNHEERVSVLCAALRSARFALPPNVEELRAHVLGLDSSQPSTPLPQGADRSLVISPFVGDDFFAKVYTEPVTELVSRPESLDALHCDSLERIGTPFSFDDGSGVELGEDLERRARQDPGRPLVGLHAKVFAFEEGRRASVFLGSANATGAAFSSNVEVLVELVGHVDRIGIDRLCGGETADEPGLRALFASYSRDATERPDDDEEPSRLDSLRREIAALEVNGFVEESGSGWAVAYLSAAAIPDLPRARIECWPLASAGNRRGVRMGVPLDVRFETTLESISGFLAFEATDENGLVTQFVVPVPLHGVPENRERLLLKALIGSAERFMRYLLALLEDASGPLDLDDLVNETGGEPVKGLGGSPSYPVLEKLVRTMRRDPGRLAGIHPLITDLAADDALPEGFAELWDTISHVAIAGTEVE